MNDSDHAGRLRWPWWAALLVPLCLMACTSTTQEPTTQEPTMPEEPHVTEPVGPSLYLELASLTGNAVSEAMVRLSSGEQHADVRGTLLLEKLPVGRQLLQVQAEAYYPTLVAFEMAEGVRAGARLKLLPLGVPVATFDASQGTTVTKGGVTLTVPPSALLDAQGNPIAGQVDAFMTALDMKSGELVAAPGALEGIPAPGADPVSLESLGMVALSFQQEGRVIPFARGIRIRGSVPGSIRVGSQGGAGDGPFRSRRSALSECLLPSVPSWRLDSESGRWIPTGELGRIEESSTAGSFDWEITLDDPSGMLNMALPPWWCSPEASADNPLQVPNPPWVESACLEVRVKDAQGQPVAGRMVVAQRVGQLGLSLSRAMTDADGLARLEVRRNKPVQVDAGEGVMTVSMGSSAGTCRNQGGASTSVTLVVSALACTPGAARDCRAYGGPQDTSGQGVCRAARQSCDVEGSRWSDTCEGEVLPRQERCDNALDDNCD
ncbi:MAG TPA: hypothetical protein VGB96_06925, partial [Archangium sp.]